MKMIDYALAYRQAGYGIIPVGKEKKPIISWEKYQKEKASENQIRQWWDKWPDANIGIVTGVLSGLAIIDIDTEEGMEAIQEYVPDTLIMPTATTPGGGKHYYFSCTDETLRNNAGLIKGCDLRANGGYIIAPPSKGNNGKKYTWAKNLDLSITDLPLLPQKYLDFINSAVNTFNQPVNTGKMFQAGTRDNDIFHIANCLIKGGANDSVSSQVLEILAKNCNPPYSEKEINNKIKSALNRQARKEHSITGEVRDYVISTHGVFTSRDINSYLGLTDSQNKRKIGRASCRERE